MKRALKTFLDWLAGLMVERTVSRARLTGQRSIVIVGARRSGHHAILSWLVNALEGEQVTWKVLKIQPNQLSMSTSGRTIHINDVHVSVGKNDIRGLWKFRRQIRRADHAIVNFEDVDKESVEEFSWPVASPEHKVVVRRSTLNLVASRLEKARGRMDRPAFRIDESLLDVLMTNRRTSEGWIEIDFDSWLENPSGYRGSILREFGQASDIDPTMSTFGDGSSFSGTSERPSASSLTSRYLQISWPPNVIDLLLRDEYADLLTTAERDFLESLPTVRSRSAWL